MPAYLSRVCIVTVSLNNRVHIDETIRSVLEQTYPAIEYVVVDGGSTDGTVEVIRSHASRLATWISEPDGGIADAFNKGLRRVNGDYILFLNAGDRLATSDAVSEIMHAAREANYPEIVFGDCDIVDGDSGRHLRRLSMKWCPLAFRFGRMINHPATFTHASYFVRYGEFDTSFRIAMDFELMARGILKSRVLHVHTVTTTMRSGGVSTRDREAVVKEIVRALRKNSIVKTRAEELFLRGYFTARRVMRHPKHWLKMLLQRG
ncbi:MAG TPA: glycosyltransferase family 2 protein [Burkholderiales bacterium]|nr:glycosyltransferase family 2 protein [Burkholderiales bacterium]